MKKLLFLLVLAISALTFTSCDKDYYDQYGNDSCTYCGCGYAYIDRGCRCCCHTHWPMFKHRGKVPGSGCCHLGWKGTVYDPLDPGTKSAVAPDNHDDHEHGENCNH